MLYIGKDKGQMMKKIMTITIFVSVMILSAAYNVGDTVDISDNISWTDNYGYTSDIFSEVAKGKPVMIFFGQTW